MHDIRNRLAAGAAAAAAPPQAIEHEEPDDEDEEVGSEAGCDKPCLSSLSWTSKDFSH